VWLQEIWCWYYCQPPAPVDAACSFDGYLTPKVAWVDSSAASFMKHDIGQIASAKKKPQALRRAAKKGNCEKELVWPQGLTSSNAGADIAATKSGGHLRM
jgi:hypothetical protein